jgi:hypothetical protein
LNRKVIDDQFYNEELTPVQITKRTTFKIDKILSTRVRRGIREYLVRWKGYGPDFDSWINAASEKKKWILAITFTLLCLAMPHPKHPSNTLAEFTVQLAQRIDLGSIGSWEMGLCELSCPLSNVDIELIYCDLIMPHFVGSQYTRCLRTLTKYGDHTFNVYYLPVEKRAFQYISILIADLRDNKIPFMSGDVPTKAVPHFRRI